MERRGGAMGVMAEMEGVLKGVLRGVQDDRLGRPTPERFHKSRVSKQGSVSGKQENLNEAHHLLAEHGYCCLLEGKRLERENSTD
ncbi:hypothetical protein CesoFtcFv8_000922 [Champsocephalus esox]|uniref:Uncharacterized protein n=2 Tax=Champsocephalus esox TaxID=159716 RepID=A0AAN8HH93_9TELE|nr:hypothetical protein CesoFtcFv8_000922 [Champsocephalus esox]